MHSNSFLFIICGLLLAAVSIFAAPPAPSEPDTDIIKKYDSQIYRPNPDVGGGEVTRPLRITFAPKVDPKRRMEFAGITEGFLNSEGVKNNKDHQLHDANNAHIDVVDDIKDQERVGAMFKVSLREGRTKPKGHLFIDPPKPGESHMIARIIKPGPRQKNPEHTTEEYHHQPERQGSPAHSESAVSLGAESDTGGKGKKRQRPDDKPSPEDEQKEKKRKTSTSPPRVRQHDVGGGNRGRRTRPWSPSGPRRAPSPGSSSHRRRSPQRGDYDRRGRGNNSPPPRRNYVGSSYRGGGRGNNSPPPRRDHIGSSYRGGQTRAASPMRHTVGGGGYRDRRYSSRSRSRSRSPPSRYHSGNDGGRGQGTSSSGGAAQGHGGTGQYSNRDWVPNDKYTREHPRGP